MEVSGAVRHIYIYVIRRLKVKRQNNLQLQTWTGPEGSRRLRPYAPAAFTPRKYSWYSFLLEAESTPGP